MSVDPRPWREAWQTALYAAGLGFYVTRGGPSAHFTTAAHGVTGAVLADSLLRLWSRERGDAPPSVVVDVGAGRGELAAHVLAALEPAASLGARGKDTRVVALDVVDRPEALDDRVEWLRSPGGAALPDELHDLGDVLVVAHEWLDVVPCDVAQVDAAGTLREVLVDPETGDESLGEPVAGAALRWAREHWRPTEAGGRVEIGRTRDAAWADLVGRVRSGLLVAIDYGHVPSARPSGGTLAAYHSGQQVHPVPDGTCDLTAHVAMDTLDADRLWRQRELLRELGLRGERPPQAQSLTDPLGYVRALERAGAEGELIRPGGFGDFWWAVKHVNAPDVP